MLLGQVPMAEEIQEPDYGVEKSLLRLIETHITGGDGGREHTRLLKARALYCPVGQSRPVLALRRRIEQVALTDASVFVTGEAGTGKEWVARYIHALSPRHARAFVAVNCAAIPASQIDDELFGREHATRAGFLEEAQGGTLFLDEIGELSAAVQAKLLRVLKEGSYGRSGSRRRRSCNVRFMAASRNNPGELLRAGRLRRELFFRLNLAPISLAPLRERRDDLPELVTRILERCRRLGQDPVRVQAGALRILGLLPLARQFARVGGVAGAPMRALPGSSGRHRRIAASVPGERAAARVGSPGGRSYSGGAAAGGAGTARGRYCFQDLYREHRDCADSPRPRRSGGCYHQGRPRSWHTPHDSHRENEALWGRGR